MGRNRVRFVYDHDLEKSRYKAVKVSFGLGMGLNAVVQATTDEEALRIAKEREPAGESYEIIPINFQRFFFDDKHVIR